MGNIYNRSETNALRRRLRNEATRAELMLWEHLQGKKLKGLKFRRQYGVGPYVVDFYCPKFKLAIELDGDTHYEDDAQENDRERENYIKTYDVHFLRFTNNEVYGNLDGVLEKIREEIDLLKNISHVYPRTH